MIGDERACSVDALPPVWRAIASGAAGYGITDRKAYVEMAQIFLYKMTAGDLDLFTKREEFSRDAAAFRRVFGALAYETLEFYGHDFHETHYPEFEKIKAALDPSEEEYKEKVTVIEIAEALFAEFGAELPGSFYFVHLAPVYREKVCEIVPLRFSARDRDNARAWDAALHGQKVFPMQLTIQSISSQRGFFWEHGCGCNHGLSRLGRAESSFQYRLRPEMRTTWVRDFLWTCWYEYAFFFNTPVTGYLIEPLMKQGNEQASAEAAR
jgi:hypothetical protein